jgi:signal transduction histidine kinase
MPTRNHRKRALLFLAAVLLPSAVLVGTTVRLIRQQRELAVRRTAEERSLLALQLGQGLLEDLRRLGDRVAGVPLTPRSINAITDSEPAVVIVAAAMDGRLVFPWETDPDDSSPVDPARLARHIRLLDRGGVSEYQVQDFAEAARWYAEAVKVLAGEERGDGPTGEEGDDPPSTGDRLLAEARVHQARALLRAGQTEEARTVFHRLARSPPYSVDREGMPFTIYGLEGLLRSGVKPEDLLPLVQESLDRTRGFALPGLLAWRDLALEIAAGVDAAAGVSLRRAVEEVVASRAATLESLENLRRDFPGLLATTRGGRESSTPSGAPSWIPYGREPWLVGVLAGVEGAQTPVAVIQPALMLGPAPGIDASEAGTGEVETGGETLRAAWRNANFLPAGEAGGESLGPALNGLRVSFPPGISPPLDGRGVEGWLFRLLLPVILILTGFTAYLAWRDVRRETEAVRLRSQFVSSVTHELKTPLTSIRMFAETLRLGRHSSPEVQREYLDTVVHETERLSRLINNVLDFARIERGEKTYHMGPTDVGAAAREAARAVAYPLAQGNYTLNAEIAEDLPLLDADSDALTQALLNLLTNAIKFSPEGTEIGLRVLKERGEVLFQVADQGRGIPSQDHKSIFRDFYRTADAEEEGIPGTGLGLSLVAHVANAHGGRVEVESEVGQGSLFTIRIPVGEGPPAKDGTDWHGTPIGAAPAPLEEEGV